MRHRTASRLARAKYIHWGLITAIWVLSSGAVLQTASVVHHWALTRFLQGGRVKGIATCHVNVDVERCIEVESKREA